MALNMSNATNARSQSGKQNIINDFSDDINRVNKALTGTAYTTLLNTIRGYWVGADEQAFEKDLRAKITTIQNEMTKMKTTINSALSTDYNQFISNQSRNYQAK